MQNLLGSKVLLKPLSERYISPYLQAFLPPVRALLHVPDLDAEYRYITSRLQLVKEQKTFFFCVFERFLDVFIGAIEIRPTVYPGQLYTWLHPQFWGNNYFQEALYVAARYYFSYANERYFTARVDTCNKRSYKALKKCSFADYHMVQGGYNTQYELLLINKS